jgi:uncharacterized protein YndB with AHSA1/START domain/ketosteroid isomerase-like protein
MSDRDAATLDITILRMFDAPPEAVFAQWLDADALKDWFAPGTYEGLSAVVDARVGGAWAVEFQSPDDKRFREHGVYKEIDPGRRIVMTLNQDFVADGGELLVAVTFEARGGGTMMRFHQSGFKHPQHRDAVAEGWEGCIDKLAARLRSNSRADEEIRSLFDAWFEASERKDLDAAMAPIASDIVSYEHSIPLEVRDVESMRAECKTGFDRSGPEFRWDIPDLRVIVQGDLAVTWGLNRMADYAGGVLQTEMWSRGTRIFRRFEGEWRMIHQHVSFPMDPATGMARFDMVPQATPLPGTP